MPRPPDSLKAFAKHGALLDGVPPELRGDCPICGSASRKPFCVNVDTKVWHCKACGLGGGGLPEFLAAVLGRYQRAFRGTPVLELESQRGIPRGALRKWGIGYAAHVRSWALPQRLKGAVSDVALWRPGQKGFNSKGTSSGLYYAWDSPDPLADEDVAWICEGAWDPAILDHILRTVRAPGATIGVSGSSSFPAELVNALVDKHAVLAYDCDVAGREALAKARAVLEPACASVSWISWPAGTPDEFDVRDVWIKASRKSDIAHERLMSMLVGPYGKGSGGGDGAVGSSATGVVAGGADVPSTTGIRRARNSFLPKGKGLSRRAMIAGFRKWLHLPDPTVLDVVFGTAFANRIGGNPVWLFLTGPPGCGKTVPIQALFNAPLVKVADIMTPASLVSGSKGIGMSDPSQIPKWMKPAGQVVAMKDFTTVLSLSQNHRDEVFSFLRSAYDGRIDRVTSQVERHFRGRFGIIAGVTPEIERFGPQHSVVGERFIRFRVRDDLTIAAGTIAIDMTLKAVINRREDARAADLTEVARATLDREIKEDEWPDVSPGLLVLYRKLSQWVASMRGAVARDKYARGDVIDYKPQAEIGTRIGEQLLKLSMGIAVLRRRKVVGLEEFLIAVRVARDSAPGISESICKELWLRRDFPGESTATSHVIAEWTRLPHDTVERVLGDGWLLRVFRKEKRKGSIEVRWGLSLGIMKLMEPLGLFSDESRSRRRKVGKSRKVKGQKR